MGTIRWMEFCGLSDVRWTSEREWRSSGYVYIGRHCHGRQDQGWGNPFMIGRDGSRADVLAKYEAWTRERLANDRELRIKLLGLVNKVLVCWCRARGCHGEILHDLLAEAILDWPCADCGAPATTVEVGAGQPNTPLCDLCLDDRIERGGPPRTAGGAA